MFETAIRSGEVIDLQLDDLDLIGRLMTIRRGKGGRGRVIPIGQTTTEALLIYLDERERHPLAHMPDLWFGPPRQAVRSRGPHPLPSPPSSTRRSPGLPAPPASDATPPMQNSHVGGPPVGRCAEGPAWRWRRGRPLLRQQQRVGWVRDRVQRSTGLRGCPCIDAAGAADIGEPIQLAQQETHVPADPRRETEGRQTVPVRGDDEVLDDRTSVP